MSWRSGERHFYVMRYFTPYFRKRKKGWNEKMCMRTTSPQEFHPQHQELHINHVWLINKYATTKSKDNLKLKLRTIFCREKGSNRLEIDGPNISRWYKYPGINEREREGGPGGEVGLKMKREKIKIMTQVRRKMPFKQNATLKDYNLKLTALFI